MSMMMLPLKASDVIVNEMKIITSHPLDKVVH